MDSNTIRELIPCFGITSKLLNEEKNIKHILPSVRMI